MTNKKNYRIPEIITLLFIIMFLYAGISKLIDYQLFKDQITESPILEGFTPFIAATLLCAEFTVVALLAIPRWRLKGLYASLILMILFTGYIIMILITDKGIPCSCGGLIELLSLKQHIIFNSSFILLAILGIAQERRIKRENKRILATINNIGYAI